MKTTQSVYTVRDWKPRRRADIYCSPACGGGCTHAAFVLATKSAKSDCKIMGRGWTSRVWENLGWHYRIQSPCGRIRIHHEGKSFTAFFGEKDSCGGRYVRDGKTAREALENVIKAAKADLALISAILV